MKNYQYNEKPTSVQNIGQDIKGAARHHRDTYETPEDLRKKSFVKKSKASVKALKSEYQAKLKLALAESTESAMTTLKEYEFRKTFLECDLLESLIDSTDALKKHDIHAFKSLVLGETDRDKREILRKKFNRLVNTHRKIRYIRPIELSKYFEPKTKDAFREVNGHEVTWKTESKTFDVEFLKNRTCGVQFGNSISETERVYCAENLIRSIQIFEKYFSIDFSQLGFSYGARGKAGSIAHYQDSNKVLAFNRGWDGALVHELGHAIDYSLGRVSSSIPWSIRSKYRDKIEKHEYLRTKTKYYMKPTEIFARMFEAYVNKYCLEKTSFMIFLENDASLPDLDAETETWFRQALGSVLKG